MANNSKDAQLIELKDTIAELRQLIKTLQQTLESANAREASLKEERDNLKEKVDFLTKKLFGASSEKRSYLDIPGQYSLFNEMEVEADSDSNDNSPEEPVLVPKGKPRKPRPTDKERFENLPTDKKYLDIPENERVCSECGTELKYIGEEFVRRELVYHPGFFTVTEFYSKNYECPNCSPDKKHPVIVKGKDGKAHMLYGLASASTVAWVIYQKFVNSIPLYRQEQDWKQYGVSITRATLSSWLIKNVDEFLTPMYEFFRKGLLLREFLMADETPTQVLKEEDRRPQSKSYMWLFRTGEDGGTPIVLFKYSPTRAGDTAVDFLDGYHGYLMCDGYSGYNKLPNAKRLACWAHVRRYLLDAIPKGKQNDYSLPAVQGVIYCDKLFALEKDIKQRYSSPDAIKEARLKKEKPILEAFWAWFDELKATKNSKLDSAITYIKNRRKYLEVYLEDGRCSLSNNLSENAIRPFTVGRKNWLFSDTPRGADSSAVAYSIVETAKANGINVYHYIRFLLEELPKSSCSDEELESLAPWNPKVKAEIERRIDEAASPKLI